MKTGLWTKVSKKGVSYAVGKIKIENKEYKIVLFFNNDKKNMNAPDFNLILEEIQKDDKSTTNEEAFAEFGELTMVSEDDLAF